VPEPETTTSRSSGGRNANKDLESAVEFVSKKSQQMIDEVSKVIIGNKPLLRRIMYNILAGGNILFEDYPGTAKSLMSNMFSQASGCDFRRIQFTPDLLPADIMGIYMYNEKTQEFEFRPGPLFTNFLLADEINRAPPKTQAALLETMQERQVTVEGTTHQLTRPYVVFATQNPIEQEGTYPLPEAQMDRFLMQLSVGFPDHAEETEILSRRIDRQSDDPEVHAVTNPEEIVKMQDVLEYIEMDHAILEYISSITQATRNEPRIEVGSSPRGAEALLKLTRARAAFHNRTYVTPDDVKELVPDVLHHRLILKPEPRIKGVEPKSILDDILKDLTAPKI
jgi:MoxR-like ATPase